MTDSAFLALRRQAVALAIPTLLAAHAARAQSNLSSQGFGYPPGQFSARANGAGGSIAEMDPLSPLNPASIALLGTRLIFVQIEPEFRTVSTPAGVEQTTTARYPVVFGAIPVGSRWVVSIGSSTILDRTATTSFNTTQTISLLDTVPMTTKYRVDGAMDDVRLAAGWTPASWLHLGIGAHAITGHNLVNVTQSFVDTIQFSAFTQARTLGFSGSAASAGLQVVVKDFTAAMSGRYGGTLHLSSGDTLISSARVPNRFGASLAYTGLAFSSIAIRTSRDGWSSLGGLGTPGLHGVDAWDTSVGADIAGPRTVDRIVFLRGGFRTRTLPFQAAGQNVTEQSYTGGLGTTFANQRIMTDLALIYANRSANIAASEHAWTISIGIGVRP
jgi:hypothetical protein